MAKPFSQLELFSTYQFTWVGSSAPSSLTISIKTASETMINSSLAMIQSGGGNWYAFITLTTTFQHYPVSLLSEITATISTQAGSASPFLSRTPFELIRTQAYAPGRR